MTNCITLQFSGCKETHLLRMVSFEKTMASLDERLIEISESLDKVTGKVEDLIRVKLLIIGGIIVISIAIGAGGAEFVRAFL